MRVYIECEESRKNGLSYGGWVDVERTAEEIDIEIQTILYALPVDSKGFVITNSIGFSPLEIPEKMSIGDLVELVKLVDEYGDAYLHYADHVGIDYATEDDFLDVYTGEWDSEKSFAEELFNDIYLHEIPENLQHYIDYESFAHDLFMCDYYILDNCYIFRSY